MANNDTYGNSISFEKFAQEANKYLNDLAAELGHPEEKNRVLIAWRAVMHTVRDRIHFGESFDLMGPLPMIYKAYYVQDWKYSEKPPLDYETMEEFTNHMEKLQDAYGEQEFSWNKPTADIAFTILNSLKQYYQGGQLEHLRGQMPKEVQEAMAKNL